MTLHHGVDVLLFPPVNMTSIHWREPVQDWHGIHHAHVWLDAIAGQPPLKVVQVTARSGVLWNFPVVAGPECVESTLTSFCPPLCPACHCGRKSLFPGQRCLHGGGLYRKAAKVFVVNLLVSFRSLCDLVVFFFGCKVCLLLHGVKHKVGGRCQVGTQLRLKPGLGVGGILLCFFGPPFVVKCLSLLSSTVHSSLLASFPLGKFPVALLSHGGSTGFNRSVLIKLSFVGSNTLLRHSPHPILVVHAKAAFLPVLGRQSGLLSLPVILI